MRSWPHKFADAFRGIGLAVRSERSFAVHLPAAALVLAAGAWLQVSRAEWALLALAIAGVLAAEIMNSAVERLARALEREKHEHLGAALDMASGAVLIASLGAAAVGLLVLGPRFLAMLAGPSGG